MYFRSRNQRMQRILPPSYKHCRLLRLCKRCVPEKNDSHPGRNTHCYQALISHFFYFFSNKSVWNNRHVRFQQSVWTWAHQGWHVTVWAKGNKHVFIVWAGMLELRISFNSPNWNHILSLLVVAVLFWNPPLLSLRSILTLAVTVCKWFPSLNSHTTVTVTVCHRFPSLDSHTGSGSLPLMVGILSFLRWRLCVFFVGCKPST